MRVKPFPGQERIHTRLQGALERRKCALCLEDSVQRILEKRCKVRYSRIAYWRIGKDSYQRQMLSSKFASNTEDLHNPK